MRENHVYSRLLIALDSQELDVRPFSISDL